MTVEPTSSGAPGLVDRAKNILLSPKAEWAKIASEPADINRLYVGYLVPLLALAAVCEFIGMSLIGVSFFGTTFRVPMVAGLVGAVIRVVVGVVGVYVLAFIINALAPSFGSQQDMGQAQKLAVYSSTAGLLAGVFAIYPPLAVLGLLGLYSFALLYFGLEPLMKTPEDKRIAYTLVIIVVAIVVFLVIGVVVGAVTAMMGGAPGLPTAGMVPSMPK
jgi:hypothetical protein